MAYPTGLDSFSTPLTSDTLDSPSHATLTNAQSTAITALETKLGIGSSAASGATAGDVLVSDGSGGSAWGAKVARAQALALTLGA